MSIETDRQSLTKISELVNQIREIAQSQPNIEFVNWESIVDDLLYFESSLNREIVNFNDNCQD